MTCIVYITDSKTDLSELFFCSCSFLSWYPKDAWELCVDSFIAVCLFIAVLFWLTMNGTCSSLSYYRAQVGTTCRPTSVSGRPPLFETISFILTKGRCYIFQHSFDSRLPPSIIKTHSWAFYRLFGRPGVILGRIVSEGKLTCGSCWRIIQNVIVLAQESVVNFWVMLQIWRIRGRTMRIFQGLR